MPRCTRDCRGDRALGGSDRSRGSVVVMRWTSATDALGINQDAYWCSADGRFAMVADGGARPDQHAELASSACCRIATALYNSKAGDELIDRIVLESNRELLRRVSAGEAVGTTGASFVHVSASGAVLAASFRDSPVVHGRDGQLLRRVRPRRKYDYTAKPEELAALDATFAALNWKLRIPLEYHLPYADLSLDAAVERLDYRPGDVIVICSDGVSDVVTDEELVRASDANSLVTLARERSSRDDATCLVGR